MEQRLSLPGPTLWTRPEGARLRPHAEELLATLNPGDALIIDLKGIEAFDFSFANEYFGKLILRLQEHPGRFLLLEHANTYVEENLTHALESLGLLILHRKGRTLRLLGKAHAADQQTLDAFAKRRSITAADLAATLQLNTTAANERLKKFTTLGILRRERTSSDAGREQYTYHLLQ
jgi:hypothetical protein